MQTFLLFLWLCQLEARCLGAFPGNGKIARHRLFPDVEGMRLARFTRGEYPDLRNRGIKFRMVRHQDGGLRRRCRSGHLGLRFNVGIEVRGRAGEVERRAAGICHGERLAVILDRENHRKCPLRMPWRGDEGHCRIAQCNSLSIVSDDVALRLAFRITVNGLFDGIPIGTAYDDAGGVPVLHEFSSAYMIGMRMADDYVLNLCRIETQLFQPAYDFLLRVVRPQRVEEDDSLS